MNSLVQDEKIMRRKEVESFLGLSRSWLYAAMDPNSRSYDPSFPLPIRLGARSIGWSRSELHRWLESRKAARPTL